MEVQENLISRTPNGNLCYPPCDEEKKPQIGMIFNTLHEGVKFYQKYADECGFEIRKSTNRKAKDGTITRQYVVCNREGIWIRANEPLIRSNNSEVKKRKTTSCKVGCKAKVIFKCNLPLPDKPSFYKITEFFEGHTHSIVPLPARDMMQSNRNVDEFQQRFIMSYAVIPDIQRNYGKLQTHWMHRNLEMFLKFFHEVDEENKLRRIIWADKTAIKHFRLFGEAVSFDATYNTNRYKLIFTPFTGKDNHGKCISFGATIISNEDTESYSWVLDKFVEIMGHAPRIVITDQDPGLRKAIAACWKDTCHRFCMWHINMKVAEKVPPRLREDTFFKSTYDSIVWTDNDEVDIFEEKWNNMINEFDLSSNRWFTDMFEDRSMWIPAYFRRVPMSGLFRTTSMSESENSYFKRFLNKTSDLVLLYTNYYSGLDAQRYNYKMATHYDETRNPRMVTNLPIERNASAVFTNSIFKLVQDEIDHASKACGLHKMHSEGSNTIYEVDDSVDGVFAVNHFKHQEEFICSCQLFIRKGIPCKHMFFVFRILNMDCIPQKYIAARWCKFSILCPNESYDLQSGSSDQTTTNWELKIFKVVMGSIAHVRGNEEMYEQLHNNLSQIRDRFSKQGATETTSSSKHSLLNEFYGSAPTDSPTILPPDIVKTKGSGVGGRRKSEQEKAMILANKPKRLCRKCKTIGHHDSRNCPTKESDS